MISFLPNLPDNVIGIAASGQVEAKDYEYVLMPAVEAALQRHPKLRLLYRLGSDFEGFTPGAMWDDMKLGIGHLDRWEKIAVVTDVGWIAGGVRLFSFAMPCPVKVFAGNESAAAEAWIVS